MGKKEGHITGGVRGRIKEKMKTSFLFERNLRDKHIKFVV